MKALLQKPAAVFLGCVLLVCTILFTIPINLFDGEVIFSVNGRTFSQPMKMSLSYFIGLGINDADMQDVQSFRLTGTGYLLAGLMTIGFPALIAYRVWLGQQDVNKSKK